MTIEAWCSKCEKSTTHAYRVTRKRWACTRCARQRARRARLADKPVAPQAETSVDRLLRLAAGGTPTPTAHPQAELHRVQLAAALRATR